MSAPTAASAPDLILDAALRRVVEAGAPSLSMQVVAAAAGVSKGLVHYHFHDKTTLLARVLEHAAARIVARERVAAARAAAAPAARVLDVFWQWLDAELARGDLRALAELAADPAERVRDAARHAAALRHAATAETVARLFAALDLRPRVPAAMLADVIVAFVDGLAMRPASAARASETRRVAYDVFWLALLSLAD